MEKFVYKLYHNFFNVSFTTTSTISNILSQFVDNEIESFINFMSKISLYQIQ